MPAQERIGPMPKKESVTESFDLEAGDTVGEDCFTQSSHYTSTCRFLVHSSFLHVPVAQKPRMDLPSADLANLLCSHNTTHSQSNQQVHETGQGAEDSAVVVPAHIACEAQLSATVCSLLIRTGPTSNPFASERDAI
jgi:hypothetical protein